MMIRPHKVGSVVARLDLPEEFEISNRIEACSGAALVVRALEEKRVYDVMELTTGRMAHVGKGDVLVGALGQRDALRGFVGRVPSSVSVGDTLHLLNLGGVLGEVISHNKDVGQPLRVEVLGAVLRNGQPANIADVALGDPPEGARIPPVILVSGTCMNSGKTLAACEIISRLTARGLAVGGAKLTGVSALRDLLNMGDHGAAAALSFTDFGLPSTAGVTDVAPVALSTLSWLETQAGRPLDVIVAEAGDGIIGCYGVESILQDKSFMSHVTAHVLCANDLVAAWGGVAWLAERGLAADVIAGPATDNEVGVRIIRDTMDVPAANARTEPEAFVNLVQAAAFGELVS
jgi:hypothetical protein